MIIYLIYLICLLDILFKYSLKNNITKIYQNKFISISFHKSHNLGFAYGIFRNLSNFYKIFINLVSILFIYFIDHWCINMILIASLCNLLDRIINGYVIDYIIIKILNIQFNVFNLSDVMIVIGVILILIF
jgi:signal peptidase II